MKVFINAWEKLCGINVVWHEMHKDLQEAIKEIQQLKKEFWKDVRIPGDINEMNPELDKASRVADFIELGELMCIDALQRNESAVDILEKNIRQQKEKH